MIRKTSYGAVLLGLTLLSGGCAADRIVSTPAQDESAGRFGIGRTESLGPAPLFILDGERLVAGDAQIERLNPNRIDSVEVLKGDAAVRLYGTEGANGVVVITTKGAR